MYRTRIPKVEYPAGSNHFVKIRHPPLSTLSLRCPQCDADVDVWCHDDADGDICEARKLRYTAVYDRYIHKVQTHNLPLYVSEIEQQRQIKMIIQEVEYDMRGEPL